MPNGIDISKYWSPAFDTMEDFVFLIGADFNVVAVNRSFLSSAGGKSSDFIGKKCFEIIHHSNSPADHCPHQRMTRTGQYEKSEFYEPLLKKWLFVRATPVLGDDGEIIGSIHMAADITQRKKFEEMVLKQKKELDVIIDSVPAWIFYKDRDNRFIRVNKAFADIMGFAKESLEGKSVFDLFERNQAEAYWMDDKKVISTGEPISDIIEPMESTRGRLWVKTDKIPYRDDKGEIIGVIGFSIDITEQKAAKDKINDARNFLDKIINAAADPIFVKDRKHRWILVNDAFCAFMGRARAEVLGKSDYEFFPVSEADVFWRKDEEVFATGLENINEERFTDITGAVHTIVTKKTLYRNEAEEAFIVGIIRDITEVKKTELALKESEEKYKTLYDASSDAIMLLDPEKGFISGNAATLKIFGCTDEREFVSRTPADFSPPRQPDSEASGAKAAKMIKIALERGSNYFEWMHARLDGTNFYAAVLLTRLTMGTGVILQATVRDISGQKQMESELKKKLESLEKFQRVTVDRELRMKELKAKIVELESRLKEAK